jgi:hypothetical protein
VVKRRCDAQPGRNIIPNDLSPYERIVYHQAIATEAGAFLPTPNARRNPFRYPFSLSVVIAMMKCAKATSSTQPPV